MWESLESLDDKNGREGNKGDGSLGVRVIFVCSCILYIYLSIYIAVFGSLLATALLVC